MGELPFWLQHRNLVIDNLQVGSVPHDPTGDFLKHPLYMCRVVADHHTRNGSVAMVVVHFNLGNRDVELFVQACQQWFQRAPLIFERVARGKV